MMYSIGKLAQKYNLSRSTLLYYDRLGILRPSLRSSGNYRMYSDRDDQRLEKICLYRQAGIKLKEIAQILDSAEDRIHQKLEARLRELNDEVEMLRHQQQFIAGLLKNKRLESNIGVMNRRIWVSLLKASGFSEQDMWDWHRNFEKHAPQKHQAFLEFLCIPRDDIDSIRKQAQRTEEYTDGE